MLADIKLFKAQICKIIQSLGFLGSLLNKLAGLLLKVAVLLAKNILAALGITATASAVDAETQKKKTWFRSSFILRFANNFNNFKQNNE